MCAAGPNYRMPEFSFTPPHTLFIDAALQAHWSGLLRRALKQPVEAPPPPKPKPAAPPPPPAPSADAAPSDAPAPRPRRWKFWSSDLQPPPSMPLEEESELTERDLW